MTDFDLADGDGVRWSAFAVDIDSGETLFSSHPERVLDTASIGKLFLLHTVLDQADHGRLDLTERVERLPFEMIDDSGLWYLLHADALSIYDICVLIGAASDNSATNVLCRRIGLDAVRAHTRELGYEHSGLDDIVRWPIPPGMPGTLSHGTAAELVRFVGELARSERLSASSADILRRWLGAGMDCSMVASAFNFDPLAHFRYDHGTWLWNKTGTISTVRGDVGVAMSRTRRIAYAVLANWGRVAGAEDMGAGPAAAAAAIPVDARDAVLARMRTAGEVICAALV